MPHDFFKLLEQALKGPQYLSFKPKNGRPNGSPFNSLHNYLFHYY